MLNVNSVTRLPFGLSTTALDKVFSSMPFPDVTKYHVYDNDFDQFVAADWTVTETQAGATQALSAGDGGLISLVNSAANNDVNQIQKTPAAFLMSATKQAFFKARLQVDDASLASFAVGLQVVNADGNALASALDGMFFLKAAGAATINFYVRKDNTTGSNVATAIASVVAATMVDLAFYYDGAGRTYYAVNDNVLGYLDASSTYFPDTILSPIIALKNGSAVARTLIADKFFIAQER
jgi:hypothetical protein